MTTLLIDLSHHNQVPNWAALKAGGIAGVILKASEGTSFADPVFPAWRAAAHAAGLAVGMYGFADLGSAAAEAAWFAKVVGGLQPGEFVGLDEEVTKAGVDPVVWAAQWIDALHGLGIPVRLLYINKSFLAAHDWTPIVQRGVQLWLADYDGSPTATAPSGPWRQVELKQFTSAGTVPGETGTVDVDALWGALTDLTGGTNIMATLDAQDIVNIANAVWGGAPGANLVYNYRLGHGEWAGTTLGAIEGRMQNEILPPLLAPITSAIGTIAQQVTALAQQVTALQQAVAAAPGMTCQGNPAAVALELGQKLAAPTATT